MYGTPRRICTLKFIAVRFDYELWIRKLDNYYFFFFPWVTRIEKQIFTRRRSNVFYPSPHEILNCLQFVDGKSNLLNNVSVAVSKSKVNTRPEHKEQEWKYENIVKIKLGEIHRLRRKKRHKNRIYLKFIRVWYRKVYYLFAELNSFFLRVHHRPSINVYTNFTFNTM